MTKQSKQKLTYLGSFFILAGALLISSLPFSAYLTKLTAQGQGILVNSFAQTSDLSLLPLGLTGRFFFIFFPFIALLVALLFVWRFLHGQTVKSLFTGASCFRYKLMAEAAMIWLLISALSDVLMYLRAPENYHFNFEPLPWLKLFFLGLIFIPPQIALEEVFFRSYLIKGGTLFNKNPLVPFILFSVLFGLLHWNNPEVVLHGPLLMMPQYIGMGLFLAYLAWRTKGLELSLGIHLANNLWGILVVNGGGTAFTSPSFFLIESWDPHSAILALFGAIFLFLFSTRRKVKELSEQRGKSFYFIS